jgi:hypothetical protein
VKTAVETIEAWLATAKLGDTLPFKAIIKALGMDRRDFKPRVRSHADFIEAIAELGVVEWGKGTYFTGFTLAGT